MFIDQAVEALSLMGHTCSLDVADEVAAEGGRLGKRRLGRLLGMTPWGATLEVRRAEQALRDAMGGEDE
jgi:hypothetical protein